MLEDWMVSAAMAIQGQGEGTGSHSTSPAGNGVSVSFGLDSVSGIQLLEQLNPGNDYAPKVRKPYTITKHRERWTEEEHKKFLEALKLYGRGWRKIEEHVGSKTAVQIRSHAQKFFSKVTRDSNRDNSVEPVEIPPPRPKRKPVHPYPQKIVQPPEVKTLKLESRVRSSSPNSAIFHPENQSPTSVLLAFGSETLGSEDSDTLTESLSPKSIFTVSKRCLVLNDPKTVRQECILESTQFTLTTAEPPVMNSAVTLGNSVNPIEESAGTLLRLFGRTVLVTDYQKPFFPITANSRLSSPKMHDQQHTQSSFLNFRKVKSSADNAQRSRNNMTKGPNYTANRMQHQSGDSDSNTEEARAAASVLCSFMPNQKQVLEEEHEQLLETSFSSTSLVDSRPKSESSETESHPHSCCKGLETKVSDCTVVSEVRTKCERSKGFVPYQRFVPKRDGFCSMLKSEETEEQPTRLSL